MDLLGEDTDSDHAEPSVALNIDNTYAAKYDQWRGKEHLQKLKDKYGEDYEEDESESDDEMEDEDAEELTEEIEKDFFTTLASLKKKDPKIYDGKTEFFTENKAKKSSAGVVKEAKVTIGDIEREVMLEKGGKFEDLEDNSIKFGQDFSYNEEMKSIKDSFKKALSGDEVVDDELLSKRSKSDQETKEEAESYKKWLAGHQSEVKDPEIEAKMEGLRDYWNKDDLDEGEKFLKDYLLNKRFLENDQENYVPRYDEIVHDSDDDLSADESNVNKQEEFEHKFNFRFEEPDEDFIKRYPRTIKDTLRKDEDKRKEKRKEVEERKKHEKEIKKEELKMLKNMKKKEIMEKLEKLKKITGNDDMELNEEDIEGDFDPEKYDKKMQELFSNYDDNTVAEDEEKPTFSDIDEDDYDEDDVEDWDNWTSVDGEKNAGEPNCEDEGFNMDCDFQQEMIESSKGRKKGRRKSKFAEAIEKNTSKPVFDPNDKTFTEYVDEYYKLDCEDLIGDLPCRFKYRSVQQNDFGLSVEEVLAAPDKELNAWVSLRKTCQYRSQEEERKDFHVFRNKAKDQNLKKRIMPTLFDEPGVASVGVTEEKKGEKESTVEASETKKRKRNKKKKKVVPAAQAGPDKEPDNKKIKLDSAKVESNESNKSENTKNKRSKKKKKKVVPNNSAIKVQKIAGFFEKSRSSSEIPNSKKSEDLLQFSNERLKAYGVNPNQFKRKLKKEKYRNIVN
eukprot:GFUD01026538.1.p1 GENE.GFUD01026538.1~~GFUD01026538.1.p1  ORF type:complete len:728 (+),score=313.41 GFUD01026538.1:48-2231(+)